MVREERPENMTKDIDVSTNLAPLGDQGLVSTEAKAPLPPQGLSQEEEQQLRERAMALVD